MQINSFHLHFSKREDEDGELVIPWEKIIVNSTAETECRGIKRWHETTAHSCQRQDIGARRHLKLNFPPSFSPIFIIIIYSAHLEIQITFLLSWEMGWNTISFSSVKSWDDALLHARQVSLAFIIIVPTCLHINICRFLPFLSSRFKMLNHGCWINLPTYQWLTGLPLFISPVAIKSILNQTLKYQDLRRAV